MAGEPPPSNPTPITSPGASAWKGAWVGALIAALLHAHLIMTPFWQDDFAGIERAIDNPAFISSFVPDREGAFLRPISVGVWWWLVTRWGEPPSWIVHLVKLGFFSAMVACVGVLAAWLAGRRLMDSSRENAGKRAFWAALLYGAHNAFFLPIAWGSGAQEILGLLFSAFALLGWMAWGTRLGRPRWQFLAWAVLMQLLAHGSKEGTVALAVAVPLLLLLAGVGWPRILSAALLTIIIADMWMQVRSGLVAPPEPGSPYEYVFGLNMARNGGALLAFAAGLPRESIQLFILHRDPWALAWGVACLLLFAAGAVLVFRGLPRRLPAAILAAPWLLFGLSLAPYVPLRWNCYPYYTLFGLMAWPVLVALSWSEGRRMRIAGAFIIGSAVFCALGEHWAPYPAPLARAKRIAAVRESLSRCFRTYPPDLPVILAGSRESDFYAGLGWNRGLDLMRPDKYSYHFQSMFGALDRYTTEWRFIAWNRDRALSSSLEWPEGTRRGRPSPPSMGVLYFHESGVDFGHIVDMEQLRTIWSRLPGGPLQVPERMGKPLRVDTGGPGSDSVRTQETSPP